MGTWGTGPYDSDTAEDYLGSLTPMTPRERLALVTRTLHSAIQEADLETPTVLPEEVIAAATIVAESLPGAANVPWPARPPLLPTPLPADLAATALRALDATIPPDNWWWQSWTSNEDREQVTRNIGHVRTTLQAT